MFSVFSNSFPKVLYLRFKIRAILISIFWVLQIDYMVLSLNELLLILLDSFFKYNKWLFELRNLIISIVIPPATAIIEVSQLSNLYSQTINLFPINFDSLLSVQTGKSVASFINSYLIYQCRFLFFHLVDSISEINNL
jgi:hypothetical protein